MLNKYIKPFIIGVIQCFLLVFFISCIAPLLLINTDSLNNWQAYFQHFKWKFLVTHGVFYALLYFLWPFFIHVLSKNLEEPPNKEQYKTALQARIYLIGVFLIFECLILLR